MSAAICEDVKEGRADYVPVILSEIPNLYTQGILPIDVAPVRVSPPDQQGYCSLRVSVDIARSAVNTAWFVIAQVNGNGPRTHGDGLLHSSRFNAMVECNKPLYENSFDEKVGPDKMRIGEFITSLIEDRSTLQMGIGSIPDAVLHSMANHKDLGVHTEMCSNGIVERFEKDINNKYNRIHPNKAVRGFALGHTPAV